MIVELETCLWCEKATPHVIYDQSDPRVEQILLDRVDVAERAERRELWICMSCKNAYFVQWQWLDIDPEWVESLLPSRGSKKKKGGA